MNLENNPQEQLDADILQCRADILRALQHIARSGDSLDNNPKSRENGSSEQGQNSFSPASFPSMEGRTSSIPAKSENTSKHKIYSFEELQNKSENSKDSDSELDRHLDGDIEELISNINENSFSEIQNVSSENDFKKLKNTLEARESELNQKNVEMESLKQIAREEQRLRSENSLLASQLETLQKKCQVVQEELENAKLSLSGIKQNESVFQELHKQLEQQKRKYEELEYSDIESRQKYHHERTVFETRVSSLEYVTDQLKNENQHLVDALNQSRQNKNDFEQKLNLSEAKSQLLLKETADLRDKLILAEQEIHNKILELKSIIFEKEKLHLQNMNLANEAEKYSKLVNTLQAEAHDKERKSILKNESLCLRIAELEDQIREYAENQISEKAESDLLAKDYKIRLDQAESQIRDLENKLSEMLSVRQAAAESDKNLSVLREQIAAITKQRHVDKEQIDQLSNQVRQRDEEIERLLDQLEEYRSSSHDTDHIEIHHDQDHLMPHTFETNSYTLSQEQNIREADSLIPTFNLGDQILAEQRREISVNRQGPAGRTKPADSKETISKIVKQFTGNTSIGQETNNIETKTPPVEPIASDYCCRQSSSPAINDSIFADIVKRDILNFIEKNKTSVRQGGWSYKEN